MKELNDKSSQRRTRRNVKRKQSGTERDEEKQSKAKREQDKAIAIY